MDFVSSSQRARWTFTPKQLEQYRAEARAAALENVPSGTGEPLTVEEEKTLLRYYEKCIVAFCRQWSLPQRLEATATLYLKRFYVRNSALSHDPSRIWSACIYVASKVEESYLSIDYLIRQLPSSTESVLRKNELRVLKSLDYDLIVHTPYKYVDGLSEDISRHMRNGEFERTGLERYEELTAARKSADAAVECLLRTDAPLLFHPAKLALAALRSGFRSTKKRLDVYFEQVVRPSFGDNGDSMMSDLNKELGEIDLLGVEGSDQSSLEIKAMQPTDRKLKMWLKQTHKSKDGSCKQNSASQKSIKTTTS